MNRSKLLSALLLTAVTFTAGAAPINLQFVSPGKAKPTFDSIQYRSGWLLELRLRANENTLLGVTVPSFGEPGSLYPEAGEPSWLLYRDDDDCPYFEGFSSFFFCEEDNLERFVGFTSDIDMPGAVDQHGRADLRAALANTTSRPQWGGPNLPNGSQDGIGYGANDDLPGLVLLSDTGVGIVYEDLVSDCPPDSACESGLSDPLLVSWERKFPEERHNLAGLMNSVSFELRTQKAKTEIKTSLHVPRFLFSPLQILDPCYGPVEGDCVLSLFGGEGTANRIDAGPINVPAVSIDGTRVTLRAVVVNGTAPATVSDCDGNGTVDAEDLKCLGYTLMSKERVVEFDHFGHHVELCSNKEEPWAGTARINGNTPGLTVIDALGPGVNSALADLDGNEVSAAIVCPAGGGGVLRPPR
ncbi:MAG: hypothetical protein AAGE01_14140 [Pseudomonadota bacterium]